jgi:hypothetical protein
MMYALRPDLSCISPRTLVHGMAITASKIANTKHVINYCPAIKTLPAATLIFNQKANIATGNNDTYSIPKNEYCYRKANA